MARFPDGWVFIPKVSDPEFQNGNLVLTVSVDERELVMCRNCKHWEMDWETVGDKHFCPLIDYFSGPEFFCADGERRDEADDRG